MYLSKTDHQAMPFVGRFLVITFGLMLFSWGSCALLSQLLDWTVNHLLIRTLFIVGGLSPTLASYIVIREKNYVSSFKEWIKQIFNVRHSIFAYICVLLFVAVYYLLGCIINGYKVGAPAFMLLIIVPMMLLGGGNEEVGWRMILQLELEKKLAFIQQYGLLQSSGGSGIHLYFL